MSFLNVVIDLLEGLPAWLIGIISFFSIFTVIWTTKKVIFFCLRNLAKKTHFSMLDMALNASQRALSVLVVSISLFVTQLIMQEFFVLPENIKLIVTVISRIFVVLAIIIFIDKLFLLSITRFKDHSPILQTGGVLLRGSLRIVIFCLGFLIVLSTLGISITPILASLGIGSLAVALALQPTLENYFSGIQILADKPFRVGDYIELDSGEQGFVEKIGWRSTWIKMLPNNTVIMPNSALAKSKLINYYYPEKQLSVPVEVGVHYDSDLDHVERVTLEVAKEVLKSHKWGITEYETFVIFHTFDSSSINFTVMLRAEEYFNRFFIKSAFMKELHKRYKQEGISIPYPIRAINLTQETIENDVLSEQS